MLVNTKDIQIEGSLDGLETIDMGLDESSLVHIMSVLSDLYSDPAAAVIREYITNAIDSHIAARQDRAVEITTPSRLNPVFIVQDFGLGMDISDIRNVYSRFGASTKRNTNEQAGMLGLGSKSGLTYCEQFTVDAVKNGIRTVAMVSRSSDGSGSIEIVDSGSVDAPNGVTIKIPVNVDHRDFQNKVYQFAMFVSYPLLVDGRRENQIETVEKINDDISLLSSNSFLNRDRIVMGNVSYPIEGDRLTNKHYVVYYADMGAVDFTPSREELVYTKRTKRALEDMRASFNQAFQSYLQHNIDVAKSYREAFNIQTRLNRQYGTSVRFSYQGTELPPSHISVGVANWTNFLGANRKPVSYDTRSMNNCSETGLIITNWKNKRFTKVQATKVNQHLATNSMGDFTSALLVDQLEYPDLFKDWTVLDWEAVKAIDVKGMIMASGRPLRRWESYNKGLQIVDTSRTIYYASRTYLGSNRSSERDAQSATADFYYVTDRDEKRFKEDYPQAIHISALYFELLQKYLDSLTDADKEFFKYAVDFPEGKLLNSSQVLDPELKKLIQNSGSRHSQHPTYAALKKAETWWWKLDGNGRTKMPLPKFEEFGLNAIKEKYPILSELRADYYRQQIPITKLKDHLTKYVNMIYSEKEWEKQYGTV